MVTIKDIAKKVGVSPSVVSRALNNKYGVKAETRERIVRTAKEMGYRPNILAQGLVTRKTNTIGVVMADISEPFFSQLIKGMNLVADETGYTLIYYNSYESLVERSALEHMIKAQRVDGLIIVGSRIKEDEYLSGRTWEVPLVLVERRLTAPGLNCVWVDSITGAYKATRYLIDQGHRRIAHICGTLGFQVALDRLEGYKRALADTGLPYAEELVASGHFVWQDGYTATKEVLKQTPRCTAVFAGNDTMAYGALQAIAESGLEVPRDIAVVGFDDLEFSLLTNPPLTTVRQPRMEMGKKAVSILVSILAGKAEEGVKISLTPELIIRRSA
ncbi:MAG TPA: LacI family transcriptional regulator [Firmicutes bacterium]|nr:LacI family transcriptional regulator [Bacillota bacterium]